MNEGRVIERMIAFVEEKEKEMQSRKMKADSKTRNSIVKSIMSELEKVIKDEDK